MSLSKSQREEAGFELLNRLPPEIVSELAENNQLDIVKNVVNTVAINNTPAWVFYYITEEMSDETNVSPYLFNLVSIDIFQKELRNQQKENGSLDLRNPEDQNWMSEDPMGPFRENYQEKQELVESQVKTVLLNALHPITNVTKEFTEKEIESFCSWKGSTIANEINYLWVASLLEQINTESTDTLMLGKRIVSNMWEQSILKDLLKYHDHTMDENPFISHENDNNEFYDVLNAIELPS